MGRLVRPRRERDEGLVEWPALQPKEEEKMEVIEKFEFEALNHYPVSGVAKFVWDTDAFSSDSGEVPPSNVDVWMDCHLTVTFPGAKEESDYKIALFYEGVNGLTFSIFTSSGEPYITCLLYTSPSPRD